MKKQNFYELLGVDQEATPGEIKAGYRKAAMKYHPDRNPGDAWSEEQFKAVTAAYEVLMDPKKRSMYDRLGHDGVSDQAFQGEMGDVAAAFGGIFEELFGFGKGKTHRGADLRYDITITFHEAAFGTEKQIEFKTQIACKPCRGTGAKSKADQAWCDACLGAGQVRRQQGFFSILAVCDSCEGSGHVIKNKCVLCHGHGYTMGSKALSVKIPAGVEAGTRMRFQGEGEALPKDKKGKAGDLFVVIDVEPNEEFVRHGVDVYRRQPISFVQAILGGTIEVQTLEGVQTVQIESGSSHGAQVRLSGAGIPKMRGHGRGDFIVQFEIDIPKKISREQRELLEKYADMNHEITNKGGSFFQRIFE